MKRDNKERLRAKERMEKLKEFASKVDPIEPEADLSILGSPVQDESSPGSSKSGEAVQSQVAIRTPPAAHV